MFEYFSSNHSDNESRNIFSNYIFEKINNGNSILDDEQLKSISKSSLRGYKEALEFTLSNESLELCKGNSELSEAITDNFLEFISNTQKKINSKGNHFHEEF